MPCPICKATWRKPHEGWCSYGYVFTLMDRIRSFLMKFKAGAAAPGRGLW